MKAALAMRAGHQYKFFDPPALEWLRRLLEIDTAATIEDWAAVPDQQLAGLEVLITCWGAPHIGQDQLDRMPRLRHIVHAAGTVKHLVHRSAWERGISVTSAAWANARPVAEYTLAMILLAGKKVVPLAREYARRQEFMDLPIEYPKLGNYRSTAGLIAASATGRRVIELLRPLEMEVIVYDPYLTKAEAQEMGVESVQLDVLLERSDVVSLHAPDLPSLRTMLGARQFALMRDGATFINTARPGLVDQDALLLELRSGRLDAVLDVSDPEPLRPGHELYSLPNVFLTPHLAGSQGNELLRMGQSALEEVERLVDGRGPARAVVWASLATMA